MKTQKGIREHDADELRKAKRLEPIRGKSATRFSATQQFRRRGRGGDPAPQTRESVLDYLDEEEE